MSWAVVSGIMQAVGIGMSAGGLGQAKKAEKAQSKAIKRQWEEEFTSMALEKNAAVGAQTAAYAASGVQIGVGSAKAVVDRSMDEYHRAVAAEAYLAHARKQGAKIEGKTARYAQVGGYFSSLASMANTIARATEKT